MRNDPLLISDFKCDYCKHVSLFFIGTNDGWFYTCLFHFLKLKIWHYLDKWGYSLADWLYKLPFVKSLWEWWCKR